MYIDLSLHLCSRVLKYTIQLLYVPQLALSLLTATAFSYRSDAMSKGAMLNGVAWIAQPEAVNRSASVLSGKFRSVEYPPAAFALGGDRLNHSQPT